MTPITFLRSSSINNFTNFCEHQAYLTYVLGFDYKVGAKAELGTATHAVLEVLAEIKKQFQDEDTEKIEYKNDTFGLDFTISWEEFTKPHLLSPLETDEINTTRINKDVYKWNCHLDYGTTRYGVELVDYLCEVCSKYYEKHSPNKWQPIFHKHVKNFVWITLDYNNGQYDPRFKKIIQPEYQFNIELPGEDFAYEFDYQEKTLKGQLHLKGTIDLIYEIDDGVINCCDWKSGQRKDWGKNQPKTYRSLHDDPQLLLYYYVARQLYPDKHVMMTIFFIRDGGPYTLCFEDDKLEQALNLFKDTFNRVKQINVPKLLDPKQKDFRCCYICDYYKQKKDGKNVCMFMHEKLKELGSEETIKRYSKEGFDISRYDAPGEV